MKLHKDIANVLKPYIEAGVLRLENGSKHPRAVRPDGRHWVVPSTPGGGRAVANFRSDIRRFAADLLPNQ